MPRSDLILVIERATEDGKNEVVEVAVTCRLDTEEEVHVLKQAVYYNALRRISWKRMWLDNSS